jgi:hypothetical protein
VKNRRDWRSRGYRYPWRKKGKPYNHMCIIGSFNRAEAEAIGTDMIFEDIAHLLEFGNRYSNYPGDTSKLQ